MQLLFKSPNVSLDISDFWCSSVAFECYFQMDWHHVISGTLNEVGKILVTSRIWWSPARRIFSFRCWLWNRLYAEQLLDVFPFWWVWDDFYLWMVFNAFEMLWWAITCRSRGNHRDCSLKNVNNENFAWISPWFDSHSRFSGEERCSRAEGCFWAPWYEETSEKSDIFQPHEFLYHKMK